MIEFANYLQLMLQNRNAILSMNLFHQTITIKIWVKIYSSMTPCMLFIIANKFIILNLLCDEKRFHRSLLTDEQFTANIIHIHFSSILA